MLRTRRPLFKVYSEKVGNQIVWCPTFRRNLREHAEVQVLCLLNCLNDSSFQREGEDLRLWLSLQDGSFSVSSYVLALRGNNNV